MSLNIYQTDTECKIPTRPCAYHRAFSPRLNHAEIKTKDELLGKAILKDDAAALATLLPKEYPDQLMHCQTNINIFVYLLAERAYDCLYYGLTRFRRTNVSTKQVGIGVTAALQILYTGSFNKNIVNLPTVSLLDELMCRNMLSPLSQMRNGASLLYNSLSCYSLGLSMGIMNFITPKPKFTVVFGGGEVGYNEIRNNFLNAYNLRLISANNGTIQYTMVFPKAGSPFTLDENVFYFSFRLLQIIVFRHMGMKVDLLHSTKPAYPITEEVTLMHNKFIKFMGQRTTLLTLSKRAVLNTLRSRNDIETLLTEQLPKQMRNILLTEDDAINIRQLIKEFGMASMIQWSNRNHCAEKKIKFDDPYKLDGSDDEESEV